MPAPYHSINNLLLKNGAPWAEEDDYCHFSPGKAGGLSETCGPSKGLEIQNTVMNLGLMNIKFGSASSPYGQVGEIPDQVRDDNFFLKSILDKIYYEWLFWIINCLSAWKSHIPENVKLCESPGRAGGLPKC